MDGLQGAARVRVIEQAEEIIKLDGALTKVI
jgi:hypothetical protein